MKPQEFLRGLEELSTVVDVSDVKSSIIASLISNSREHLVICSMELRLQIYCRYHSLYESLFYIIGLRLFFLYILWLS